MSTSPPVPRAGTRALVWLVLSFAMLWVPLGQHDFLHAHWMKLGTFMAPFLLFAGDALDRGEREGWRGPRRLSLLLLVAYIAHQFEEHWVDVEGNVYAFHASVNGLLQSVTGTDVAPLSPAGIFVINTSLVWLVAALAMWRSHVHVFPALAMVAIVLVNGAAHIALAVVRQAYNPGLLTSVVLFLPAGAFALRALSAPRRQVAAAMAWGVLAHVIMVGGLVAGNVLGLFPEPVYFAALVLWSVVPILLFRPS